MKKRLLVLGVLALLAACRETVPVSSSGRTGASDVGPLTTASVPVASASGTSSLVANPVGTVASAPSAPSADASTASIAPRTPKVHRAMATACSATRAPSSSNAGRSPYPEGAAGGCSKDVDCKDGKNGRCGPLGRRWGCSYDTCRVDKDCDEKGEKGVCECRTGESVAANACKKGNCRTDADCKGSYCSPSLGSCGHIFGNVGYYCHTPKDECNDDDDCPGKPDGACRYIPEAGYFKCATGECKG